MALKGHLNDKVRLQANAFSACDHTTCDSKIQPGMPRPQPSRPSRPPPSSHPSCRTQPALLPFLPCVPMYVLPFSFPVLRRRVSTPSFHVRSVVCSTFHAWHTCNCQINVWIHLWKALETTMDFKPSVSVLFGHYSLPGPRILTKVGRTKFEKTT